MSPAWPVTFARDLDGADAPAPRFLVNELWSEQAVGIVGGEPKCCKSFLALHLAVAVASGTPCLGRFAVPVAGRVLLYPAEDAVSTVRRRLDAISRHAGTALADLDVGVIATPSLRLDQAEDRDRLARTIDEHHPVLVILDPFVRLHRKDENAAGEIAPLLAFLRELQREARVAIAVVHHARKNGGAMRGGQALRGSSEFHAWGDSNLYLRRKGERLCLQVEHRAAASPAPVDLRLVAGEDVRLEICDEAASATDVPTASPADRVVAALAMADAPLARVALRDHCRMKTAALSTVLVELVNAGRIARDEHGQYLLVGP